MKSVKIREIAEALQCAKLIDPRLPERDFHLTLAQSEMLAELAIRSMITPTEEMLRVGVEDVDLSKAEMKEVWEEMCREALR